MVAARPFDVSRTWVWVAIVVVGGMAAWGAFRALGNNGGSDPA
jgi:hypothetical protein